jgi:excinuclease UvrABC nuclease subunit
VEHTELIATLTLAGVQGVGAQRLRTLVATFGSAAVLEVPQAKLAAIFGMGRAAATAIKEACLDDGSRVLASLGMIVGLT